MRLPAGAVQVQGVEGEPALFDDKAHTLALRGEGRLDDSLDVGPRLHGQEDVVGGVADLDMSGSFPGTGELRMEGAADA